MFWYKLVYRSHIEYIFKFLSLNAKHKRGIYHCVMSLLLAVTFMYFVETARDMAVVAMECE